MIRLISKRFQWFSNRKQNFFQLNPVYPDYGEKDFDIYNVQRNRVKAFDACQPIKKRESIIDKKVKNHFLMRKYRLRQIKKKSQSLEFDQQSGLPLDINAGYDAFIVAYKKHKRLSSKIQFEFKNVLMELIKKFQVKSEFELIKIFRISLAHSKKQSLKEQIRGKLMEEAIIRASSTKNDYFSDFFSEQTMFSDKKQRRTAQISQDELNEASFQQALKQIDKKIQQVEHSLRVEKSKTQASYDEIYGQKIDEKIEQNKNYDINLKRGAMIKISVSQNPLARQSQNEYIRKRINKLFFMQKLKYLKKEGVQKITKQDFPVLIREKDKIINELAYKYKQYDFMIEPDLKEIYQEIDLAIDKINIRFSPDTYGKSKNISSEKEGVAVQKNYQYDQLLWQNLNVEKVFTSDYYSQQNIDKQFIDQKQLLHISPSAGSELSLARAPFNLHRHSECQIFNVFTKQKHLILKDSLRDTQVTIQTQFDYFSLQEAQLQLRKIKRQPYNQDLKYYGHAKRKKSEAQVYLTPGIGITTINGKPINEYFADTYHRVEALKPLMFSETGGKYDLQFNVVGGGVHGQSECMAYALARALMRLNPDFKRVMWDAGLGGYDYRRKEPKRMGLYSARVRPPYVRR